MKGLLNIQPVHVQLKHFVSHEKKPSRVQSAREYSRRSIHDKYDSSTNLANTMNHSTDDTEVIDETNTAVKVQSARTLADIHVPQVEHLLETNEDVE
ncbi:unnamed protein product [Trichobilharzia szidati]|nr:unnamed protein product [Trichobilharzia szidati]